MDSLRSHLSWDKVVGAVVAYYATLAFYRLFLHPLARFPGPKLAAISRWYEGYYDVIQPGQYTHKIAELHKQYGPIIRISPHELHVSDPAFFETLYRMDGRWDKYAWTYDAFGASDSTIFCSDHYAHKARRAVIAPLFSKTKIAARQELIHRNVDKLCGRITGLAKAGTTFNFGAAASAFARSIANGFVVGKDYGELDADDFSIGLSLASQGAGGFWRTTKFVRWFGPALRAMPIGLVMKISDDNMKSFFRHLLKSEQDTKATVDAVTSSSPDPIDDNSLQETLVHAIIHSNLPPSEKTLGRVRQEVSTVTGAGYETTAAALRLIFFNVFSNPTILARLRAELASATATTTTTNQTAAQTTQKEGKVPLKTLEQLPYLTAVLTEGLRLSPAIGTRAARITDKDLRYSDWRIHAGTPVGMTTLLVHTDEALFPEPMRFVPERWLSAGSGGGGSGLDINWKDGVAGTGNKKWFAPFSRGTRVCLGMHLAWAEMYLLLAALVQRFDFQIEGATAEDFLFERDNFGIGTKAGCNLLVRASLYKG